MTLRAALSLFALLTAVASGCPSQTLPTLPVVTSDNPRAEADLRAARQSAEEGHLEEAVSRYRTFLQDYRTDPLIPVARLALGRLLLAVGGEDELAEAQTLFQDVARHDDESLAERGRFYGAVAQHLQGEHAAALEVLRELVGRTVDPEETALLLNTIAAASEQLGDPVGAVEAYDAIATAEVADEHRVAARERLESLIASLDSEALADLFARLPRDGAAWPLVATRGLRQAYAEGALDRVREIAEALEERRFPLDEELQAMVLRAERTGVANPNSIGAILPLSGRGREVGQLSLQALMLAAGLPPDGPVGPNTPQLHFRDSGGNPLRAVEAVNDLATLHQVIAIVGPAQGRAARAAAERAQELGVPLLALSADGQLPQDRPMVFRMLPSADDEARRLVEAAKAQGASRVASFHPSHGYGSAMTEALRRATEQHGLGWGGEVAYDPGTTSFGEALEELSGLRFDALLLPDHARRLLLVAPALAAAGFWSVGAEGRAADGARPVHLMIPGPGLDEALLSSAVRYLEGAVFSTSFFAPSATGTGAAFVENFRGRYRQTPDAFAAAAFDAFGLLRSVVRDGAMSRDAVAAALGRSDGHPTIAGSGGLRPNGSPARGCILLQVRSGTLVEFDPRPR